MDKGNEFGAFLTDLSKAFDCSDHKLLIAELFWYGVWPSSIKLVFSYLSNWTQRVQIKNKYSDKSKINYGVPQNLILPMIQNTKISYTDDTTPYSCADDITLL